MPAVLPFRCVPTGMLLQTVDLSLRATFADTTTAPVSHRSYTEKEKRKLNRKKLDSVTKKKNTSLFLLCIRNAGGELHK